MTLTTVIATIEHTDGRVEHRTYESEDITINALKRKIRRYLSAQPTVAHVACGNGIYQFFYGAH